MSEIDLGAIKVTDDPDFQFAKRGRKKVDPPAAVMEAVRLSYDNNIPMHIDLPDDDVNKFKYWLTRTGLALNLTIQKTVEENTPQEGMSRVHFKARAKLNVGLR